jgi:succinate dehydrogenase / fumarate reductase cytochrome b subunit
MFNRAAHFMGASLVIRIMEFGLFAGFLLHIIQGYVIEAKNRTKRSSGYKIDLGSRGSPWMSRSMALLGTFIFLFLIIHVAHFWVPSRITHDLEPAIYNGKEMHNVYLRMFEVFQQGWVVILYLVGVASLAFHLLHGFHSAFRTMGVHNKKYLTMLKGLGYGFTAIASLLFALMPLSMYLQWVTPYN